MHHPSVYRQIKTGIIVFVRCLFINITHVSFIGFKRNCICYVNLVRFRFKNFC